MTTNINTKMPRPTLAFCIALLAALGHNAAAASYEDDIATHASSAATIPNSYGHPAGEVHWAHGWLSVSVRGKSPTEIKSAVAKLRTDGLISASLAARILDS